MKTNGAPEKIYLDEDESWHLTNPNGDSVEYIRTNAFIEKAVEFLKGWDTYRVCLEGHKDWFIEQFKEAMKL